MPTSLLTLTLSPSLTLSLTLPLTLTLTLPRHAYEPGIRVPLFFSALGGGGGGSRPAAAAATAGTAAAAGAVATRWRRGVSVAAPVTHLDLRPTLVALAEGARSALSGGVGGSSGGSSGGVGGGGGGGGAREGGDAPQSVHALLLEGPAEAPPGTGGGSAGAPVAAALERLLEARPIFIEAGYSRAVLAGRWTLLVE